eukprot:scaffold10424_cov134-Isochrysis_galbana.AAC.1
MPRPKAIKKEGGHLLSQAAGMMPRPASYCDGGDGCRECGTRGRACLRRPSLLSLPLQGPLHGVSSAVLVVCCSVSSVCSCFFSSVFCEYECVSVSEGEGRQHLRLLMDGVHVLIVVVRCGDLFGWVRPMRGA